MAEQTNISWTDHTFNPWWGCTKIAPGCDNCYAAALDKRTGGTYWSAHESPRITNKDNWKQVQKWHRQALKEGVRRRVFCGSMMDWCDNQVPDVVRAELFELIKATPMLDWQLLTKRATRIKDCLPDDWGDGYDNVWLGVTCEAMKFGYPRIAELKKIPAKVRFVSAEPLLEQLHGSIYVFEGIEWVIVGGESGANCRQMNPRWAKSLIRVCLALKIPVWFKQIGGNTQNKGGSTLFGREYKQWPKKALALSKRTA